MPFLEDQTCISFSFFFEIKLAAGRRLKASARVGAVRLAANLTIKQQCGDIVRCIDAIDR